MQELKKHLKTEFINRIDEIILFEPLSTQTLAKIADSMMKKLKDRLEAIGCKLNYSYEVCQFIADKCNSKGFGARPIARSIKNDIENEITNLLIADSTLKSISININNGKLEFEKNMTEAGIT